MSDDCAEADGGPLTIANSTWSLFVEGLSKNPDGAALVSLQQPNDHLEDLVGAPANASLEANHLIWTYRQLERGVNKLAICLSFRHGVGKGCTITSFIWNSAEYVLFILAAGKLKATYAPLDPRLLGPGREEELNYYLTEIRPSVVVTNAIDKAIAARFADERLSERLLAKIVCNPGVAASSIDGTQDWINLVQLTKDTEKQEDSAKIHFFDDGSQHDALILFSSGTTGKPKGIIRTAANMAAQSNLYKDTRRLDASSVVVVTTLCFRAMTNSWAFCAWRAGSTIVFPSSSLCNAETAMKAIVSQKCTHFTMVPTTLRSFLQDPLYHSHDFSSLRYVELVGDVITQETLAKARQLSPEAIVLPMLGMTEGSAIVSWAKEDAVTFTKSGIAGVGRVSPGCRVRICKSGTKDLAKRQEVGDLHVGGLPLLPNYLGGRHEDDFYADVQGRRWFVTGDRAMMDRSGVVYVLGRFKDVISRGGFKLSPVLLEKCLEKDENVQVEINTLGRQTHLLLLTPQGRPGDWSGQRTFW